MISEEVLIIGGVTVLVLGVAVIWRFVFMMNLNMPVPPVPPDPQRRRHKRGILSRLRCRCCCIKKSRAKYRVNPAGDRPEKKSGEEMLSWTEEDAVKAVLPSDASTQDDSDEEDNANKKARRLGRSHKRDRGGSVINGRFVPNIVSQLKQQGSAKKGAERAERILREETLKAQTSKKSPPRAKERQRHSSSLHTHTLSKETLHMLNHQLQNQNSFQANKSHSNKAEISGDSVPHVASHRTAKGRDIPVGSQVLKDPPLDRRPHSLSTVLSPERERAPRSVRKRDKHKGKVARKQNPEIGPGNKAKRGNSLTQENLDGTKVRYVKTKTGLRVISTPSTSHTNTPCGESISASVSEAWGKASQQNIPRLNVGIGAVT